MAISSEIRWILNNNEFQIVEQWFEKYNISFPAVEDFDRSDYYLNIKKHIDLGIKIRDAFLDDKNIYHGKLEIKKRIENLGKIDLDGSSGCANRWIKYSFDTSNDLLIHDIINQFTFNDNEWIEIKKNRLLLKYDCQKNKIFSSSSILNEGCSIELTKFLINKKLYFTLGFESFGTDDKINLFDTLFTLFSDIGISNLKLINSKSYPEIIQDHSFIIQ